MFAPLQLFGIHFSQICMVNWGWYLEKLTITNCTSPLNHEWPNQEHERSSQHSLQDHLYTQAPYLNKVPTTGEVATC